jgi:hypothetical protein
MRERITYVQKLGDSIEPSALTIESGTIRGPEIHAALEDRLTIAFGELPPELQVLLGDIQDLHIRWVSTVPYEAVSPLLARLPPGFHLFTTPGSEDVVSYVKPRASGHHRHAADAQYRNGLCATLSELFGEISCSTPAVSLPERELRSVRLTCC